MILEWAEIKTEGVTVLHWPFQTFYRVVLTPLFGWYLRSGLSHPMKLECRNSVLKGGAFNVFRSDIDYAIVFPFEPSTRDLKEVGRRYGHLKRLFPFVGELECYTQAEWDRKLELAQQHSEFLAFILFYRKAAWQFAKLASGSVYQRRKAGRALMRMVKQSGRKYDRVEILEFASQKASQYLAKFNPPQLEVEIEAYSHHLGWSFGTAAQGNEFLHLTLSAAECVLFAALIPGGLHDLPQHEATILELRAQRQIAEAYRAACTAEYLLCCSVRRMNEGPDHVLEQWLNALKTDADLTFSGTAP